MKEIVLNLNFVVTMVKESNQLVDIITQNVNTIVLVINRDGELIYVSNSVERILGYNPNELLGEYWWRATRKDEFSALEMLENFKELVRTNEIVLNICCMMQILRKNGFYGIVRLTKMEM
ncbi:MAG: PAS domain-containing protein [Bacteroidota bacterium]